MSRRKPQQLHYKNLAGMLVRGEDGLLLWRCPDCGKSGSSGRVLKRCPECKNEVSGNG